MMITRNNRRVLAVSALLTASALALSACGSSGATTATTASSGPTGASPGASTSSQVLPVTSNPIQNSATAQTMAITSVLVENNVDPTSGKITDDHLELALKNSGSTTLEGFEIYYTFKDSKTGATESYYAKLPASFTIAAGQTRLAHFDNTGATDHFPVNQYSLY